jgi:hypothetical protein
MLLADQMRGKEISTVHLTLPDGGKSGYKPFSKSFPNHSGGHTLPDRYRKGKLRETCLLLKLRT